MSSQDLQRLNQSFQNYQRYKQVMEQFTNPPQAGFSDYAPEYYNSLNAYLYLVKQKTTLNDKFLVPLYSPILFFYLRNPSSKTSDICSIFVFHYFGTMFSSRITPKTFPCYLTDICGIPYLPGPDYDRYYSAFEQLLRQSHRTLLQLIVEQIRRFNPVFAANIGTLSCFQVSKEQNLFVDSKMLTRMLGYQYKNPIPQSVLPFFQRLKKH